MVRPVRVEPAVLISVAVLGLMASWTHCVQWSSSWCSRRKRDASTRSASSSAGPCSGAAVHGGDSRGNSAGATEDARRTEKTWLSVLELILAVVLMVVAARRWRRRHDTAEHRGPPAAAPPGTRAADPRRSELRRCAHSTEVIARCRDHLGGPSGRCDAAAGLVPQRRAPRSGRIHAGRRVRLSARYPAGVKATHPPGAVD